jgi:aryl-alcohol dehydrogenase-like predicted oxidoreductase
MQGKQIRTISGEIATPLGLAGSPTTGSQFVARAWSVGVNYFFFYNQTYKSLIQGIRRIPDRDRIVVATGIEKRDPVAMRAYLDQTLELMGTDMIDIFFAEYVSPSEELNEIVGDGGALDEIQKWKDEGRVRYVGATSHSRPISTTLLGSGKIDVLMHRYNMAHRGSEEEVLPYAKELGIPVVAFTCTRWGTLLKGHDECKKRIPGASDCYRFVLNNPAVQVALSAPASEIELSDNLSEFSNGLQASEDQIDEWGAYGKLVYGTGSDAFETRWP